MADWLMVSFALTDAMRLALCDLLSYALTHAIVPIFRAQDTLLSLREPNLHVRPFFQLNTVNEANFAGAVGHDDGLSSRALAKEADTLQQRPLRDPGGGKDELLPGS